jgi:hypothetical protein
MIPVEPLAAAAGGTLALLSLLIAWKVKPKGFGRNRNLVIVIDDKVLNARKS